MSGDHGQGALRAGARYQKRLRWSFLLIGTFFLVEAAAGILTNSLALLSDAGHMLTDVGGLRMALAAIYFASRANAGAGRTYGLYRLEILAALANAVLLFGIAAYVLWEAVGRLSEQVPARGRDEPDGDDEPRGRAHHVASRTTASSRLPSGTMLRSRRFSSR